MKTATALLFAFTFNAMALSAAEPAAESEPIMVPETAEQAREVFIARAKSLEKFRDVPAAWWARLRQNENWHAEKMEYSSALERVEDTLRESEKAAAIRHGVIDDLRREGMCWHVEFIDGFFSMIAYLDARTGDITFLWCPSEG